MKWLIVLVLATVAVPTVTGGGRSRRQSSENKKVVCYYANWAVYRQGSASFSPQNINPYLCTHLIYAFGGLGKDDKIVPFDEYQDIKKGGYGRFAALKTYNRDLKTMLAIGGWNEGSTRFSPLVADPERRRTFVISALRFLRQYNFDGLDLDWEYPTQRQGGRQEDRENYAILVSELREAFESEAEKTGKERLLISMAVPASLEIAGEGYAIDKLDNSLDFFNLLTYDYHSAHEPAVNHHAPLFRPDEWSEFDFRKDLNIDATIKFYVQNGASRDKLVLGIPTYGRSFTLANPDAHEIDSPATAAGEAGPDTKEAGYLAYYEICDKIIDDGWEMVTRFPGVMGPYAHKGNQWVGFDDVDIAVEKAFYVADEELGGIMFWTIDNDDFRGSCGETPFPIIESAKEALYSVGPSNDVSSKTHRFGPTEPSKKKIERPSVPQRQNSPRAFTKGDFNSGSVTTPAPPTTPASKVVFECRNEGFFADPATCKKYFWCLDTPSQGMVAHTFSCPQGLYFNTLTDGCDFLRNVNCGDKDIKEIEDTEVEDNSISDLDPTSLKNILDIVKSEDDDKKVKKPERNEKEIEREAEERKIRISSKTKSRLSQLLNRGRPPKFQKAKETSERFEAPIKIVRPRLRGEETNERGELKSEEDKKQTISLSQKQRLNKLFNRSRPPKLQRVEGGIRNITEVSITVRPVFINNEPIQRESLEKDKESKKENDALQDEQEIKSVKEVLKQEENHRLEIKEVKRKQDNQTEKDREAETLVRTFDQNINPIKTKTSVTFSTSEVTRVKRVKLSPQELENFMKDQA